MFVSPIVCNLVMHMAGFTYFKSLMKEKEVAGGVWPVITDGGGKHTLIM